MDEFVGRPDLIRKRARSILIMWFAGAIAVLFIGGTLALLSYNAVQSIKTRNALLDCTEVSGECHQEAQAETGEYIKQLLSTGTDNHRLTRLVVVYAAACADAPGVQGEKEIQACIDKKLHAHQKN